MVEKTAALATVARVAWWVELSLKGKREREREGGRAGKILIRLAD